MPNPIIPTYENRRFSRVPYSGEATIELENGNPVPVQLQDISICGLSVDCETPLALGITCTIKIPFEDYKEIELKGIVVRVDRNTFSIAIVRVKETGYQFFRELILANAEAPSLLDNEIVSRYDMIPDGY